MEEVAAGTPGADARLYPPWLGHVRATAAVLLATVVTDVLYGYLGAFQRIETFAVGIITIVWLVGNLAMFLPWSGLWALASRVVRQEAHFTGHLNIALIAALVWTWTGVAIDLGAFALSLDAYSPAPYYAAMWLIGAWALGGQLRLVSRASGRTLSLAGAGVAGCLAGLVVAGRVFVLQKAPAIRSAQATVYPHRLRLASPVSIDVHLRALGTLQAKVDRRALDR